MPDLEARWAHVVNAAFHLDEKKEPDPRAALVAIDSVLEAFDVEADPLEDFHAYAMRRLALGLRRALTPG